MNKRKIIAGLMITALCLTAVLVFAKYNDVFFKTEEQTTVGDKASDYLTEMNMIYIDGQGYLKREGITTYLVMGVDVFGEHDSAVSQADFLTLIVTDEKAGRMTLLPVSRDTVTDVNILGIGGVKTGTKKEQIALAYTYGDGMKISCRNTADAVSGLLFGTEIDHYICMTMDCVGIINDFVGGVKITFDKDYRDIDGSFLKGKTVTLDGEQALNFVRSRQNVEDQTNSSRMKRQSLYMKAFLNTVRVKGYSYSDFTELYGKISDYILTDCDIYDLQDVYENAAKLTDSRITEIPGKAEEVDGFTEFCADDKEIKRILTDILYTVAKND